MFKNFKRDLNCILEKMVRRLKVRKKLNLEKE